MDQWNSGYTTGVDYSACYHEHLNPLRARLALLNAGFASPDIHAACELGFGQGININVHAAASPLAWFGTDFMPTHVAAARALAQAAGATPVLHDDSFEEYAARTDLPEFDFISLHGVWSWISDQNRATIVEFIRRRLRVGGVVYVSYNVLPGWSDFLPMRSLMVRYAEQFGAAGTSVASRVDASLDFAQKLLDTHPRFLEALPRVVEQLGKLKTLDRSYLAHEYFNRDWEPMHFATMERWLGSAKLSFACSATFLSQLALLSLPVEQRNFLKLIPDPSFRESVSDFMLNHRFRADYWIKGPCRLTELERAETIRKLLLVCVKARRAARLVIPESSRTLLPPDAVFNAIMDSLKDHRPKSFAQIEAETQAAGIRFEALLQATVQLVESGHLAVAQDPPDCAAARLTAARLNEHFLGLALSRSDPVMLASPVTGAGIEVERLKCLFLVGFGRGMRTPDELAAFALKILETGGEHATKDPKGLQTAADRRAELKSQAAGFLDQGLAQLQALEVASAR